MDLGLGKAVVVVTGGHSGIGAACVQRFIAEGAKAASWDLQTSPSSAPAATLSISCDVTKPDSIADAIAKTEASLGPITTLVHAAAIGSGQFGFPYTNVAPETWRRVLEVNIMGMVYVAHALGPRMQARGEGSMVFIASVAGQIGSQTDPPYSATKAANINFAQCLAKDLAPHHVRVNTVCPGMVQTPLNRGVWQAWHDQQPPEARLSYEAWTEDKIRRVVPLGRWQTPEDIANMVTFLSSECARNVTGQTINVDGGFVMHW